MTNRAPADRLHDVRQRIAELRTEEERLRAGFIAGTLDPIGDDFMVEVEEKINERLDLKAMRRGVPEAIWSPYLISRPSTYITLKKRNQRGDLESCGPLTI
jgi:hypothetical protein